VQTSERRVEVDAGLVKGSVAEDVLDVVHGPTCLEQTRTALMPKIVEVLRSWRSFDRLRM